MLLNIQAPSPTSCRMDIYFLPFSPKAQMLPLHCLHSSVPPHVSISHNPTPTIFPLPTCALTFLNTTLQVIFNSNTNFRVYQQISTFSSSSDNITNDTNLRCNCDCRTTMSTHAKRRYPSPPPLHAEYTISVKIS